MERALGLILLLAGAFASAQSSPVDAVRPAELKRRKVPGVSPDQIQVFIDEDDAWSKLVLKALPAFATTGRVIFGKDLPFVKMFLMSDADRYRAFMKETFGEERLTGTGNLHIVTMCLSCENRRPEETETTAVVLHEFGHAWMNSYLHDRHGRDYLSEDIRRPCLDEGIADFIAGRWDGDFLPRRRRWIREYKVGRGIQAPALEGLLDYSSFYDKGDRELNYWISALLIERMLGAEPDAPHKIPRYLDLMGRGEKPERAWESATGKSFEKEYAALVAGLWGK